MIQKKFVLFILSVVILSGATTSQALAYGGGGVWFGAGTISAPSIKNLAAPKVAPAPQPVGQVLGVDTFRFTENLGLGMRNDDVEELQNRLTEEGFYTGPVTGFFGPLTRAAVIRYQKANDIVPASGFVGPLTRAKLNASQVPAADQVAAAGSALTGVQRENIQRQINELLVMVNGLMERLKNL